MNIKKQKEPGAWENLELRLRVQGKHDSGALRLRAPAPAPGPWCMAFNNKRYFKINYSCNLIIDADDIICHFYIINHSWVSS